MESAPSRVPTAEDGQRPQQQPSPCRTCHRAGRGSPSDRGRKQKPVRSQATPVSLVCRLCWIVGSAGTTAELRTAYAEPGHRQDHQDQRGVNALGVVPIRRHGATVHSAACGSSLTGDRLQSSVRRASRGSPARNVLLLGRESLFDRLASQPSRRRSDPRPAPAARLGQLEQRPPPSVSSGRRLTRPWASSSASVWPIDCGRTRSAAASSTVPSVPRDRAAEDRPLAEREPVLRTQAPHQLAEHDAEIPGQQADSTRAGTFTTIPDAKADCAVCLCILNVHGDLSDSIRPRPQLRPDPTAHALVFGPLQVDRAVEYDARGPARDARRVDHDHRDARHLPRHQARSTGPGQQLLPALDGARLPGRLERPDRLARPARRHVRAGADLQPRVRDLHGRVAAVRSTG